MLTMPGQRKIYQIPDQVVANYRYFVENDEEPVTAAPVPLKKGIKVRVVAGSMKGVEAYVQSYNGKKAVSILYTSERKRILSSCLGETLQKIKVERNSFSFTFRLLERLSI
jgi:transcription antitermination factor NusG